MGKLKSLITGTLMGAGVMYVGLQYHVLMAPEGVIMVPRAPQTRLQDAYADVRTWDAKTWAARPRLSLAVTDYGRADLISEGATRGVLDKLRDSIAPLQEQLGEASRGWEPAESGQVPPPIPDTERTVPATNEPTDRRGFLPLADLFDFDADDTERDINRATPSSGGAHTPILPAATTSPPEVEFLPAPDELDLGAPGRFPDGLRNLPRQSSAKPQSSEQSAGREGEWMPLSLLPDELKKGIILR